MRYLLFGGDTYYAEGGANDFLGSSDSVISLSTSDRLKDGGEHGEVDWWHIFDTEIMSIVEGTRYQAHGADEFRRDDNEKCKANSSPQ